MTWWDYITAILSLPVIYLLYSIISSIVEIIICTRALGRFPQPAKSHWFWGHTPLFAGFNETGLQQIIYWIHRFPRCMTFFLGPIRPVLVVYHPDTVREITKTSEPKALKGGGGYALLKPWFGDGLLVSSGQKWNRTRKLITPAFHADILKPYMKIYNECAERMIERIRTRNSSKNGARAPDKPSTVTDKLSNIHGSDMISTVNDKGSTRTHKHFPTDISSHKPDVDNGKPEAFEISTLLRMCTLNIILKCAFSNNEDVQGQWNSAPYVKAVTSISRLLQTRFLKPLLYRNWIYKRTDEGKMFFFYSQFLKRTANHVIKERRKALAEHGGDHVVHDGRYKVKRRNNQLHVLKKKK